MYFAKKLISGAKRPRVGSIRVNILVETKYDLGPEQEDFDWAMDPVEDSGFPPGQGSGHWLLPDQAGCLQWSDLHSRYILPAV